MTEQVKLQGQVLLAEDDENNQRLLSLYLSKMGLRVSHAENGVVAVKLAAERRFDLILMDMQMPVLSGMDAVRRIRANGQEETVIALTANTSIEDRQQCIEAGCNDFVSKPVTRDRLYQMLAQYLKHQESSSIEIEPLYSELSGQNSEFADIVNQFVCKLPGLINTIGHAYHTKNWGKLHELAHNLKGMGGGFGFPQLTEQANEIEKLLNTQAYVAIEPVIDLLRQLTQRIQAGRPSLVAVPQGHVGN